MNDGTRRQTPGRKDGDQGAIELVLQLKAVPLFQDLSAKELLPLGDIVEKLDMAAGVTLFSHGDQGERLYVIVEGEVEVLREQTRLAVLGPGECFGEMALLDRCRRSATARTLTDARMLALAHGAFHELLALYPAIGDRVAQALAQRVRKTLDAGDCVNGQPIVAKAH